MRNFIYTLLGSLGLVLLSLPALLPKSGAAVNSDAKGIQAFWSTVHPVPTKTVSDEEATEPAEAAQDSASQKATEPTAEESTKQEAVTAPGVSKHEQVKKKVKIDLSDLVLRPV